MKLSKKWGIIALIGLLTALPTLMFAAEIVVTTDNSSTDWRCYSKDKNGNKWYQSNNSRQEAINGSLRSCQNHSSWAGSCSAGPDYCSKIQKTSSNSLWQCYAHDGYGGQWNAKRDLRTDARDIALQRCELNSKHSRNCYSYLTDCHKT